MRTTSRLCFTLALCVGGVVCAPRVARAFCLTDAASTCHPELSEIALGFLRPSVLQKVVQANVEQDSGLSEISAGVHFDECAFDDGADALRSYYLRTDAGTGLPAGVIHGLRPDQTSFFWSAVKDFGNVTHTVQDFYAHSNWIELGRADLFQGDLVFWPELERWSVLRDDVILVGRDVPDGWSIAMVPGSHVPFITTDTGEVFRGLISGSPSTSHPIVDCAEGADLTHDTLNKDDASRPFNAEAVELALRQTELEWCRTVTLLRDWHGLEGPALALGLLVEPGADAHPASTPCAPAVGPVEVTVTATRIEVLDANDPGAGVLNYVLGAYTDDLRQSARSQGAKRELDDGDLVPADALPAPLTLCLRPEQRLLAGVQGWEDDAGPEGVLAPADGTTAVNDEDNVPGSTIEGALGAEYATGLAGGTVGGASSDVDITLDVSLTFTDDDGDGLGICDEQVAGTDPLSADTDGDGLLDGDEVALGTDPLDADSDDDGLDDGLEAGGGTDPLDADSDDDGLVDAADVDLLQHYLDALPAAAFKNGGQRGAFLNRLAAVEDALLAGDVEEAQAELTALREKVDGCGPVAESNDAIVICEAQLDVRALIDLLAAHV